MEATCGSSNFFSTTFLEGNCIFFLIEFGIIFKLMRSSKSLNCIYLACMVLFEKHATCTNSKFNNKRCNAIPIPIPLSVLTLTFCLSFKLGKTDGQE